MFERLLHFIANTKLAFRHTLFQKFTNNKLEKSKQVIKIASNG